MPFAGLSNVTMRASLEVSFGRTNSFGGLVVDLGRGLTVDGAGSGDGSLVFAVGLERVRAILLWER